jgi:hypothetical protein
VAAKTLTEEKIKSTYDLEQARLRKIYEEQQAMNNGN